MFSTTFLKTESGSNLKVVQPLKKNDNYTTFKRWETGTKIMLTELGLWDTKKDIPLVNQETKNDKFIEKKRAIRIF